MVNELIVIQRQIEILQRGTKEVYEKLDEEMATLWLHVQELIDELE